MLAIAIVIVVLLQRSEGGALGIGGGGGGGGGFITGRSASNLLSRTTAILAGAFMVTSLVLTILAGSHTESTPFLDQGATPPATNQDTEPARPSVPLSN